MLPFKVDLSNKVVVITGGGGVLCSAFAEALAECGAKIAILDINADAAKEIAERINDKGGFAQGFEADCLNKESLEKAREEIVKVMGACDILINGAGGNSPKGTTDNEQFVPGDLEKEIKTFFDLDPAGISFVFDLNILSAVLTTQVFAKDMVKNEHGNIINISSMNAFRPLTKIPAYSAAKAGVSNLTQWMSVHFAPSNIRVNAIAPGFFVTHQNRSLLFDENGNPTARSKKILSHTPMNRFGDPEDLIGTLLWLVCDDASGFVTGTVIPVDGGFAAYSGV